MMKKLLLAVILIVVGISFVNGQERKYHDALAFELVDHPEYVITHEGMIVFNKDGSLNKEKSTALEGYEKYQIVRDNKGIPSKIITDNGTITFKFDDMNMMLERHVKGAENYSEIFVRSQVNENGATPAEKFSPVYIMQTTIKEYIGSRSKNTSEDYIVSTDSRGNWHTIKYSGLFKEYESVEDIVDYRIITYHEPKYSYDTYGKDENDMTFIDILEKPFGLENGHEILQKPHKEIKKALKSNGIKCDSYGFIQNNTKTFYGYNFFASYSFYAFKDKTKADHYKVEGLKNVPILGAKVSAEDIFGLGIAELIEKGIPVSAHVITYGYKQVTVCAIFNYGGLKRHIYNNSTEIITYY